MTEGIFDSGGWKQRNMHWLSSVEFWCGWRYLISWTRNFQSNASVTLFGRENSKCQASRTEQGSPLLQSNLILSTWVSLRTKKPAAFFHHKAPTHIHEAWAFKASQTYMCSTCKLLPAQNQMVSTLGRLEFAWAIAPHWPAIVESNVALSGFKNDTHNSTTYTWVRLVDCLLSNTKWMSGS